MTVKDTSDENYRRPAISSFEDVRVVEIDQSLSAQPGSVIFDVGYQSDRPKLVNYSSGVVAGSELERNYTDLCDLISLLMQRDVSASIIAKSLAKVEQPDGTITRASVAGFLMDKIAVDAVATGDNENRHVLPKRRLHETLKVRLRQPGAEDVSIFIGLGYDPNERGHPREVFYSGGFRSGSGLEFYYQDVCVLLSLALQYDIRPSEITDWVANKDGAAGLIMKELLRSEQDAEAIGA